MSTVDYGTPKTARHFHLNVLHSFYSVFSTPVLELTTPQNAALTSGIVNNQAVHLVDLFKSIVGAALDGSKYSFKNTVSGAFSWRQGGAGWQ